MVLIYTIIKVNENNRNIEVISNLNTIKSNYPKDRKSNLIKSNLDTIKSYYKRLQSIIIKYLKSNLIIYYNTNHAPHKKLTAAEMEDRQDRDS
jgi:hypothetical protein